MQDGVRGARPHQRVPRRIGVVERMTQMRRVHVVAQRKMAAIAVQQRMPVRGRIEHVAHFVRPLAEGKLDHDRARRRQCFQKTIRSRHLFARVHAGGRHRIPSFGDGSVDDDRRGERFGHRQRAERHGDCAATPEPLFESGGPEARRGRQKQNHQHREARRHAKAVEPRHVRVKEVVRPCLTDEPPAASNLRPE